MALNMSAHATDLPLNPHSPPRSRRSLWRPRQCLQRLVRSAITWAAIGASFGAPAATLDLAGYSDASGAITVQHGGDTVDPYFALQALLLAHGHGLDISAPAKAWGAWLLPRQKPDATFDRFCRNGPVWAACKTADADDSQLGLWLAFMDTLPAAQRSQAAWVRSRTATSAALAKLVDPGKGIYLVSPVYQYGLLMDNLELWEYAFTHRAAESARHPSFTKTLASVFWDGQRKRFLVSTQPGQRDTTHAFYPDAVAQIFPLLVRFPLIPGGARAHYRRWMEEHRTEWLAQVKGDFAWGLVAIVALQQNDIPSARCWLQTALPHRHSAHWTVTDEVAAQILQARAIAPAPETTACTVPSNSSHPAS